VAGGSGLANGREALSKICGAVSSGIDIRLGWSRADTVESIMRVAGSDHPHFAIVKVSVTGSARTWPSSVAPIVTV
jgi:hypothetical protein